MTYAKGDGHNFYSNYADAGVCGVEGGEEVGVGVEANSYAVDENDWEFGGGGVWSVPVACVFDRGGVLCRQGLESEGEDGEGVSDGGAVKVEVVVLECHIC